MLGPFWVPKVDLGLYTFQHGFRNEILDDFELKSDPKNQQQTNTFSYVVESATIDLLRQFHENQ